MLQGLYAMKLLHLTLLWLGCYWRNLLLVSIVLFILLFSTTPYLSAWIFLSLLLLIFLGFVYHQHYAKEHFQAYCNMLVTAGKKSLKVPDSKAYILSKKGAACNPILKNRKTYEVGIIYLSENYLTYSKKCPKFHMFKYEREDRKKKFAIKKGCGINKEFYYAYIQSVHFEAGNLDIVLTSGDVESIPSEKADATKAILAIRDKLRETERSIQTNRVQSS